MAAGPFQSFQTLDLTHFRSTLAKLHEVVGCSRGRVEVTRRGCDDVCVLISKAELEGLERALEILAECAEYKSMCSQIEQLVASCDGCDPAERPAADGAAGA